MSDYETEVHNARIRLKDAQAYLNELMTLCPHNETESDSQYYPGSYLNTSFTEYRTRCKTCRKALSLKTVQGNSYG